MHNIVRSNDMILGAPFDIAGFCFLQYVLAQRLGVKVGTYSHSISNSHIYENHYDAAKEIISRTNTHKPIKLSLPENSFQRAEQKDDTLLEEVVSQIESQYEPMPAIKGLKIAL
jgi:thymidylate synthase